MENPILGGTEKHLGDNSVISHSQYGFMRGKLLVKPHFVVQQGDLGKSVDCILFDFSKTFDTVSPKILLDKAVCTQLDNHVMQSMSNWIIGQAQKVVVNGVTSNWHQVTGRVPQAHLRPRSPHKLLGCRTQGTITLPMAPNGREGREALQQDLGQSEI